MRIKSSYLLITVLASALPAFASLLGDDTKIEIDSQYKAMFEDERAARLAIEEQLRLMQGQPQQDAKEENPLSSEELSTSGPRDNSLPQRRIPASRATSKTPAMGAKTFAVSSKSTNGPLTVLPTGSFVQVKFLTGLEAVSVQAREMLVQLDHAFVGPNHTRVDLRHCMVITKGIADLSIERVLISADTISCVRQSGEHFERKMKGIVVGSDNSYGQIGHFQSKQGQVFLTALLAKIVGGVSEAIAVAETTTALAGTEKALSATNVTGNKLRFGVAKGVGEASSMVTDWYLKQAQALLPSIAVASGSEGWIFTTSTIQVPELSGGDL